MMCSDFDIFFQDSLGPHWAKPLNCLSASLNSRQMCDVNNEKVPICL